MRPLMMPEPVCASCRGSFIEKIDDPADDPRDFQRGGITDDTPSGTDPFFMLLQGLMNRSPQERAHSPSSTPRQETSPSSSFSFQFHTTANGGTRTFTLGGPRTLVGGNGGGFGRVPAMSDGPDRDNGAPGINGALMTQYLMAMLGHQGPFPDILGGDAAERGRMGDYVFNQEALDQIITQLMENSNSSRPVPATEEIVDNLPREVLTEGCATLEKDCAVCKEQFRLETEDPGEQVVVTLPCKHPFHESCILPWLKSSGTCPVCRYQLVPQPGQHGSSAPGNGPGSSGSPPPPRSSGRDNSSNDGGNNSNPGGGSGFFHNLFGSMMSGNGSSSSHTSSSTGTSHSYSHQYSTSPRPTRSPSDPSNRSSPFRRNSSNPNGNGRSSNDGDRYLPGAWDALD
ncbi:hypothetical protein E1B28_001539 [Marasmius oreades]|nr:uncharacterized protein E1B28_001539 [Marasmius oreades]KAG7099722.1 hypothetical protein E1B28_001539 [Marasmius oreades]